MKQQRFRFKVLAVFLFSLFLLLSVYGAYSVLTYGNRWFAYSKNPRVRTQKESVIAGSIFDRNGVVLAYTGSDGVRRYQSDPLSRASVVHLLGDSQGQVANGVETFQTSYLYGFHTSFLERASALLSGEQRRGDDVTLTIDSRLCTAINQAFDRYDASRGKRGAAVVLNYRTGEVLALISRPSFDPMVITSSTYADPGKPFWNRALQSMYPPGSTFKMVTMLAGMRSLSSALEQTFTCDGALTVDGHVIYDYGKAAHQQLTLTKAFAVSCNQTFARLALQIGDDKLRQTAEGLGFGDNFLFRDLVVENSSYPTTNRTPFEIAASGFGQSAITATPMHMCMIAAGIANGGVMMEPRLLRGVTSVSGTARAAWQSRVYRTAMTASEAAVLAQAMRGVVTDGTGTRAQTMGLPICGKTGTAESSLNGSAINYGWFVGFIQDDTLPFALAIVVEDLDPGYGGGSASAPIAADVFQYLFQNRSLVCD